MWTKPTGVDRVNFSNIEMVQWVFYGSTLFWTEMRTKEKKYRLYSESKNPIERNLHDKSYAISHYYRIIAKLIAWDDFKDMNLLHVPILGRLLKSIDERKKGKKNSLRAFRLLTLFFSLNWSSINLIFRRGNMILKESFDEILSASNEKKTFLILFFLFILHDENFIIV